MTDFKDTWGDDALVGTSGDDSFNLTHGGAGGDRLIGGTRSDVFNISHGGEDSIQGYLGNDALELTGGQTVVLGPTTLLGIERVYLSGAASSNITLNEATVACVPTSWQ